MKSQEASSLHHEPELVRGYTLALGIVAAFFVLGGISIYSTADSPTTDPSLAWAYLLAARVSLAGAALCGFVAFLRARNSPFAGGATALFNALLFVYIPFGTAASFYWWFAIRKRERRPRV